MAFWSKDEQTRIDETFAWIEGRFAGAEGPRIGIFLRAWLARVYGGGGGINQRAFSEALSTRHANNTGDQATRAARRALVILRGELLNFGHPLRLTAQQVMNMPSAQILPAVNAMLPKFSLFAHQEQNAPAKLQAKLTELQTTPQVFLAANELVTQSYPAANGIGQVANHRFFFDYGTQRFWLVHHETPKPASVRGNGIILSAINVPERFWFQVPGRNRTPVGSFAQIPCTEMTGADLMVTSSFNGCCFCFKQNAGGVFAAHVSPDGREAGHGADTYIGVPPTLATQIGGPAGTGNFTAPAAAQAGALSVFGRGFSNLAGHAGGYYSDVAVNAATLRKVCIVGVRIANAWQFVAQEFGDGRPPVVIRLL